MYEAYLRYVDYMVRHFKDRVAYFEIGNEWNHLGVEQYMKDFFFPTYAAIKKAAPNARVMLGNPAGFATDLILECLGPPWEVAPLIDGLGWHPGDYPDGAYFDAVREFKKKCEALGFKGRYFATEIYAGSIYPPGPQSDWPYAPSLSEIGMAKYLVRSLTGHSGLDMEAGPCHPHFTGFPHPQALCRPVLPMETINPCQPMPTYYAWRTIATILDDFYAAEFPVSFTGEEQFVSFTFESGDKKELMLAAWIPVPDADEFAEAKSDVTLPGVQAKRAWVVDIFNGTEQELCVTPKGKDTVLNGMLIKDYPTFIRVKN